MTASTEQAPAVAMTDEQKFFFGWEKPAGTSQPHVVRPPQQANALR